MRPEQLGEVNSLPARNLLILAVMLLVLIVFQAGTARATASAPQFAASPTFDSQSFVKELDRLKTGLESARKSTETLRSYRESLPATWSVDAGGRHYDAPTDLLVSRIVKAERQPELRGQQLDQAREYLDALAAEAASLSGQPPPQMDTARAKLNGILAGSEYTHARQETWWDKLRARINEIFYNV